METDMSITYFLGKLSRLYNKRILVEIYARTIELLASMHSWANTICFAYSSIFTVVNYCLSRIEPHCMYNGIVHTTTLAVSSTRSGFDFKCWAHEKWHSSKVTDRCGHSITLSTMENTISNSSYDTKFHSKKSHWLINGVKWTYCNFVSESRV